MQLRDAQQFCRSGRFREAEAICHALIEAHAEDAAAWHLLGVIALQLGRLPAAEERIRRAIQLLPEAAEFWCNLGNVLTTAGRSPEALSAYQTALKRRPNYAEAIHNLGVLYEREGLLPKAEEAYRRAVAIKPDYAAAHNHLGKVLCATGRMDEAAASVRRAVALQPDCAESQANLAEILGNQADPRGSVRCRRLASQLRPQSSALHSDMLHCLHFLPEAQPEELFQEAARWAARHAPPRPTSPHANNRSPDRPLRIGYVSADLREHPVARFFEPVFASHDRTEFHVFCYSNVARPDEVTGRLRGMAHKWRDIARIPDQAAERLIRNDRIDILIDLSGHLPGNRLALFARKPAPVQATYLGYPDTTGLSQIDYRITDAVQDPAGLTDHLHTEKLIQIAPTCWCYDGGPEAPEPGVPPSLANGFLTFGVTNRLTKVTDEMVRLWARVLHAVANSKLLVLARATPGQDAAIRDRFANNGIAEGRLILAGTRPRAEYLALYHRIDICLDTFPYNGHTTTCDALWMGVPIVTLAGRTHVSRTGMTVLANVGLADLVATDPDRYVDLAVRLAADRSRLAALRAALRESMRNGPLGDAAGLTRRLEDAYRAMWRRWRGAAQ
jgi:predicted O-linked N-acetylglucosamine transferase (SPINDLY family)